MRRATSTLCTCLRAPYDFYPRSPCGERPRETVYKHTVSLTFLSTLSLRRATVLWVLRKVPILGIFLSTLSLRRATRWSRIFSPPRSYFYPRSPCGERPRHQAEETAARLFLSTLSLRRATNCTSIGRPKRLYFYPRSPCGERRDAVFIVLITARFLSTLSLRRATVPYQHVSSDFRNFYPRSPCGERPNNNQY